MFWKKSEKTKKDAEEDLSRALVRQDPRTKVNTTTAQSVTTNSTVQNATTFNENTNKVIFSTTRQTVTHTQKARVTEIVSRRTPTLEELEDMLRTMNMNKGKGESGASGAQRRSGNFSGTNQRRSGNFSSTAGGAGGGGISTKSAPKFKNTADTTASPVSRLIFTYDSSRNSAGTKTNRNSGDITPKTPKTPTLVKIQEISFSQKTGRNVTSQTETHRVKIHPRNITTPSSTTSYSRTDARPLLALADPTALNNTTYTSPYMKRSLYTPPQPNTKSFITTTSANSNTTYKPTYTSNNFKSLYKPTSTTTTTTTTTNPIYTTTTTSTRSPLISNLMPSMNATTFSNGKKSNLKPGYAYIFNNERFDDPKNETRIGSSEDVKLLCKTFENFKLKVTVIENATLKKITQTVAKIETKDFSTYSSIVIVILSHGTRYEEIAAKDGNYSIDDHVLFPILRNRSLIDKPKLFFIQACKGAMESGGFQKDTALPNGTPSEILKCYSSFEGYVSYRNKEGSLFIQALCENLQLFGGIKNIKDIMETVTLLVKQQSGNRQIPTITSTLTKPYIFGDYV